MRRPGAGAGEHAGRLWTRELLTAVVVNTLTMLVFYLLMTTMALYAAQRFAASDSLAGLASSMFIVGAVLGRLVAGPLIGSRGPRGVLVWALVLYVAMSPAYLAAADLPCCSPSACSTVPLTAWRTPRRRRSPSRSSRPPGEVRAPGTSA